MTEPKTFLFLQGHHSFFWVRLGDALKAAGHEVRKVRVSGQDLFYWPRRGAVSYRGRKRGWATWLRAYIASENVTDIIYYSDRHPLNVDALAVAKETGVRAWTMEFGYLRPDWLTLEPEAMGAFSRFPKDPQTIRSLGRQRQGEDLAPKNMTSAFPHGFRDEAFADIGMFASTLTCLAFYPFYRLDLPYSIFTHYAYWIKTLFFDGRDVREASAVQERCEAPGADFNLLAMQLAQDYQIRASSPYDDYQDMLEEVIASFAQNAPASRRLVVKMHPLDNGYLGWRGRIPAIARANGVADRVDLIRGGDLMTFIRASKGVVLANSTVGLHSLQEGVPVKALGSAVYDIEGLTHQGPLDDFWTEPQLPDSDLMACLVTALEREIQIKGSFFHPEGQKRAIAEAVERLTERSYPAWAQ